MFELFTQYDAIEVLNKKLVDLMNLGVDETDGEQEALSQREKEIICCVVRGMTNKEKYEYIKECLRPLHCTECCRIPATRGLHQVFNRLLQAIALFIIERSVV